jgi:hypothetical protein
MNSNKRTDDEIYDISTYTDAELYDILDLSSPTDRELEAKIIFLYRKYKNMQNFSGDQLAKFFNDIYNRFFETDNEESEKGETELDENEDDESSEKEDINIKECMTTLLDVKKTVDIEKPTNDISTDNRMFVIDNKSEQSSTQKINFVKQLDYAPDTTNPLLQQTITRVISIDSQYRADKTKIPTDFTFELSDPLKDVVSLSLYSVQIPYTWYTIAKSYGSNFFYIKGNSPGINNGNHNIQISIDPGNYSPTELVSAVNNSIKQNYKVYTDISFTTTNISYNPYTSLSAIELGIIKQYNENSYHLNFPSWTTPNIYDTSGNLNDNARSVSSITSFLGLNKQSYQLNTVNTTLFTSSDILQNDNLLYKIDPSSVTIKVIKYISVINDISQSELYVEGVSQIDLSFSITLSLLTNGTKYSRNEIVADLSNQLLNNKYLKESSITLITPTDTNDIRYGNYYYQLKVKPNRYNTNNNTNSKLYIQFPDESKIASANTKLWTGNTSCFRFADLSNELQLITAETPIVAQTSLYTILQGPYISLKCVNSNFISTANDISFSIKLNQDTGTNIYTISQLVDSINAGIIEETIKTPFLNGLPSLEYIKTYDQSRIPNYSFAFVDLNYTFSLAIDIEKYFENSHYKLDFTDTSLNSQFFMGNDSNDYPITNSPLTDISSNSNLGYLDRIYLASGSVLFKVLPIQDNCGNELDNIGEIIYNDSTNIFYDYNTFSNKITSYLINWKYNGENIFTNNTSFSIIKKSNTSSLATLNLYISRKITSKDYSISFIDKVNESNSSNNNKKVWERPFNINSSFIYDSQLNPNSYDLSNNNSNIISYSNSIALLLKASSPISVVTINFGKISNTFSFIADEDGVYTSSTIGANNITITIPQYDSSNKLINYTRDALIAKINSLLAENPLSYGTYLKLTPPDNYYRYYLQIRTNVNKIFRASDYKVVFYDAVSFVKCFVGASGVQNTTWDSTLGWILGFRTSTNYILSSYTPDNNYIVTIIGDTAVSTNLYNYFLICLNDYNLNHLDDGLVTITGQDTSVPLPSYADRSNFQCDPVTNNLTYNANTTSTNDKYSQLTQNQLYALTQKANAKNSTTSNILGGQSSSSYGRGPFSKDVFAVIPMKLAGLQNGSYFVEYGGTLQNNNRYYFGPVNIHRMSIKLISDKGNTVDLNGTNWSFSFLCQQIYKKNKNNDK